MLVLQIDSLSHLKNNQGFWDNFVWPVAAAIFLGVCTILWNYGKKMWRRLFIKKEIVLPDTQDKVSNIIECATVSSFSDFCHLLVKLLDDNKYVFKAFGPNSSAHETAPLRMDMTLWYNARTDYILPNNDLIKCIVETNKQLIPDPYIKSFQKLVSHIYAFKKHIENPNFDYSEHQFPTEIEKIVKNECFTSNQENKEFIKIKKWLFTNLNLLKVKEAYIFGSVLFSVVHNKDVDVVLLLKISERENMKEIEKRLLDLKSSFSKKFKKQLHLTIFSSEETTEYNGFLASNLYKDKV